MNAKFALVIAQPQKDDARFYASESWKNFLLNFPQMTGKYEKTERIAENVWMIHLESELIVLSKLTDTLRAFGIPIRVLFFEDAPDWIKCPPDEPKIGS